MVPPRTEPKSTGAPNDRWAPQAFRKAEVDKRELYESQNNVFRRSVCATCVLPQFAPCVPPAWQTRAMCVTCVLPQFLPCVPLACCASMRHVCHVCHLHAASVCAMCATCVLPQFAPSVPIAWHTCTMCVTCVLPQCVSCVPPVCCPSLRCDRRASPCSHPPFPPPRPSHEREPVVPGVPAACVRTCKSSWIKGVKLGLVVAGRHDSGVPAWPCRAV